MFCFSWCFFVIGEFMIYWNGNKIIIHIQIIFSAIYLLFFTACTHLQKDSTIENRIFCISCPRFFISKIVERYRLQKRYSDRFAPNKISSIKSKLWLLFDFYPHLFAKCKKSRLCHNLVLIFEMTSPRYKGSKIESVITLNRIH